MLTQDKASLIAEHDSTMVRMSEEVATLKNKLSEFTNVAETLKDWQERFVIDASYFTVFNLRHLATLIWSLSRTPLRRSFLPATMRPRR